MPIIFIACVDMRRYACNSKFQDHHDEGEAAHWCAARYARARNKSDLAVWDLARIPIVVTSRHFVERRDFPPLWGSPLYPMPPCPTFSARTSVMRTSVVRTSVMRTSV